MQIVKFLRQYHVSDECLCIISDNGNIFEVFDRRSDVRVGGMGGFAATKGVGEGFEARSEVIILLG